MIINGGLLTGDGQTDGQTHGDSNSSAGLRPVELKINTNL